MNTIDFFERLAEDLLFYLRIEKHEIRVKFKNLNQLPINKKFHVTYLYFK